MVSGDELRDVLRRHPAGVSVVTVDLEGERLGLTVASLTPLALEPPLVGISIAQGAALHELLRAAGGFAVSVLAADQVELARHFARGVPPIVLWSGIEARDAPRGPAARRRRRLARVRPRRRAPGRRPHLLRRQRRACRGGRARTAAPAARRRVPGPVIAAVVFDLDGVLVDTETVWDDVREALVRERGGRWHERAQADMMGMSSREWSRYLHDELGLAESPQELNDEVVRRMLVRYRDDLPLIDGAVAAVERLAGSFPLALASSSNRPLIDAVLADVRPGTPVRGHGVVGGGRARQAGPGRVPRSRPPARCRARALRGRRGLRQRPPRGARGGDARGRPSQRALPAGSGRAGARGRRARLARRADTRGRAGRDVQGKRQAGAGSEGRRDQTSRSSRMPSLTYTERSTPSRT